VRVCRKLRQLRTGGTAGAAQLLPSSDPCCQCQFSGPVPSSAEIDVAAADPSHVANTATDFAAAAHRVLLCAKALERFRLATARHLRLMGCDFFLDTLARNALPF